MSFLTLESKTRGSKAELHGVAGKRTLVAINKTTVVLSRAGYSENPGSRYSGLMTYYPAEFEVFHIDDVADNGVDYKVSRLIDFTKRA